METRRRFEHERDGMEDAVAHARSCQSVLVVSIALLRNVSSRVPLLQLPPTPTPHPRLEIRYKEWDVVARMHFSDILPPTKGVSSLSLICEKRGHREGGPQMPIFSQMTPFACMRKEIVL